jgi:hypothetical protein
LAIQRQFADFDFVELVAVLLEQLLENRPVVPHLEKERQREGEREGRKEGVNENDE